MQRPTIMRTSTPPRAGDQIWLSPAAGVHGRGAWWAVVVGTAPALAAGALYVRVVPVDGIGGDVRVRTFYVRLTGLLVRRSP